MKKTDYTPPEYYKEQLERIETELAQLLQSVRKRFDESEYQQGKKDGIRLALTIVTLNGHWMAENKDGWREHIMEARQQGENS